MVREAGMLLNWPYSLINASSHLAQSLHEYQGCGVAPMAAPATCLYLACGRCSIHMCEMILLILIACIYLALIKLLC